MKLTNYRCKTPRVSNEGQLLRTWNRTVRLYRWVHLSCLMLSACGCFRKDIDGRRECGALGQRCAHTIGGHDDVCLVFSVNYKNILVSVRINISRQLGNLELQNLYNYVRNITTSFLCSIFGTTCGVFGLVIFTHKSFTRILRVFILWVCQIVLLANICVHRACLLFKSNDLFPQPHCFHTSYLVFASSNLLYWPSLNYILLTTIQYIYSGRVSNVLLNANWLRNRALDTLRSLTPYAQFDVYQIPQFSVGTAVYLNSHLRDFHWWHAVKVCFRFHWTPSKWLRGVTPFNYTVKPL